MITPPTPPHFSFAITAPNLAIAIIALLAFLAPPAFAGSHRCFLLYHILFISLFNIHLHAYSA